MNRRRFVQHGLVAGAAACMENRLRGSAEPVPLLPIPEATAVLDAHIHLFDPTRAGGVPWPPSDDLIYRPALPSRYEVLAEPLGVVGAIAIEASPLASDNDWLLKVVQSSAFMVGMIGDLEPTSPGFGSDLQRLQSNPLLLGIRHGNLWNRNLSTDLGNPHLWSALGNLEQSGLVLETANPDPALLTAVLQIAERLPKLTIVIDHLPHMEQPSSEKERSSVSACLRHLGSAARVFVKLSEIPVPRTAT